MRLGAALPPIHGVDAGSLVVADERGLITLFNPAAERTFGYSEPEVLGQPLTILMPAEYHEAHLRGFRRYLETKEARVVGRTIELPGRRQDGEIFPLELSLSAVELPEGTCFFGAIRDLTERHRLQTRVVQMEKLASFGLMAPGWRTRSTTRCPTSPIIWPCSSATSAA